MRPTGRIRFPKHKKLSQNFRRRIILRARREGSPDFGECLASLAATKERSCCILETNNEPAGLPLTDQQHKPVPSGWLPHFIPNRRDNLSARPRKIKRRGLV